MFRFSSRNGESLLPDPFSATTGLAISNSARPLIVVSLESVLFAKTCCTLGLAVRSVVMLCGSAPPVDPETEPV